MPFFNILFILEYVIFFQRVTRTDLLWINTHLRETSTLPGSRITCHESWKAVKNVTPVSRYKLKTQPRHIWSWHRAVQKKFAQCDKGRILCHSISLSIMEWETKIPMTFKTGRRTFGETQDLTGSSQSTIGLNSRISHSDTLWVCARARLCVSSVFTYWGLWWGVWGFK